VSLRLREKQSLYHSFERLIRSGITFGKALESLSKTTRGKSKQAVLRLKERILAGDTIADAFTHLRPGISDMEIGIISAVERTGRLDHGFAQLAEYFGALDQARGNVLKGSAYPIFVLFLGVLVTNIKVLFTGGGLNAYVRNTLITFGIFVGAGLVIAVTAYLLNKAAARNAAIDSVLLRLPLLGKMRRAFALSRFCATFEMQLDAGVNILDGLEAADKASQSGMIRAAVEAGIPKIRTGIQPSQLLAESNVFPNDMVQAYTVAEETGELEHELKRLALEYRAESFNRLEILAEWIARLLYLAVLLYVGYGIIDLYRSYLTAALKMGGVD
jgi:type IV pilus assembly protein PilC